MVVFLCGESPEEIFCGVYDAWMSRLGHANVRLEMKKDYNYEMFTEYRQAEVTFEKAEKVADAIRKKISEESYRYVCRAALSEEAGRADAVYRFLIYGFQMGAGVMDAVQIPAVYEIFRLNRAVRNEAHLLKEFLRFSELPGKVLFGRIGPKHDVVTLLMPHFSDRMRMERFLIYDEKRKKAGIHTKGLEWYLLEGEEAKRLELFLKESDAGIYEKLWKVFFNSIAISERENGVCQREHLPLRYRPYMTEFQIFRE